MQKVAISIGDLNGVGIEIALKAHEKIKKIVNPIYCINKKMLKKAAKLLNTEIPDDFEIFEVEGDFEINPGKIDEKAGKYSFYSFISAINLAKEKKVDAICTLPINKESWSKAGIKYKGHTEVLRDIFKKEAIMMLGCEKMYVALFTEHIPLKEVPKKIKKEKLIQFFSDFYRSTGFEKVGVLGLNPHAGDGGVLGDEEIKEILPAIIETNEMLNKEIFYGPLVPDIAFTAKKGVFIAMYHDQGLAPLKALYFDESINVSLNLPILRTSVDHGTAFDIAYKGIAKTKSYENAIKYILNHKN
ncbi:4-hydroxythreonine-4-phosphate dehydrogenase [Caminibacter pacificus]|uniref:4-hydroxythreonine-4-phosphate dehydrogenase n=1 Tax=Caminibacter pacificus TaxID=1424653 RepID=A0AAJ4UYL0_9BACT|nr:4-hydroxythreonine-4-phosphate dehydrogenase [Caminibacter pacificus]NPA87264.1 4-hydroxythreonine-4-phosphate dehydrogenase [Campylobacterota bacterium]QCI28196.1 4-hydroxythreonine-4-phosphate dehydrogenase [Caminibacter pacificus]ROR41090.1 4-hydroxythreonine-4-phosphate dehydrogenase [Caminibacter pacificus]